jgi:hypothetical protein
MAAYFIACYLQYTNGAIEKSTNWLVFITVQHLVVVPTVLCMCFRIIGCILIWSVHLKLLIHVLLNHMFACKGKERYIHQMEVPPYEGCLLYIDNVNSWIVDKFFCSLDVKEICILTKHWFFSKFESSDLQQFQLTNEPKTENWLAKKHRHKWKMWAKNFDSVVTCTVHTLDETIRISCSLNPKEVPNDSTAKAKNWAE